MPTQLLTEQDVAAWVPQASADPTLVQAAIGQAQDLANGFCRRRLDSHTWTERHSVWSHQRELVLRQYPVTEVASVTVDPDGVPTVLAEVTDYLVDYGAGTLCCVESAWAANFGPAIHWPGGVRTIEVEYTAGYMPEDLADGTAGDLRTALLELVAWRLGFRGSAGVGAQSADGVTTTREALVRGIPQGIAGLLERYVRVAG